MQARDGRLDRPSGLTLGAGNFFSIGPAITMPIFTDGKIRGNIEAQKQRLDQALTQYQGAVFRSLEETENALPRRKSWWPRLKRAGKPRCWPNGRSRFARRRTGAPGRGHGSRRGARPRCAAPRFAAGPLRRRVRWHLLRLVLAASTSAPVSAINVHNARETRSFGRSAISRGPTIHVFSRLLKRQP